MIGLRAQQWNTGFDDTFWDWALREFPGSSKWSPGYSGPVLHYGALGAPENPKNAIALLWELYPEMQKYVEPKYARQCQLLHSAAKNSAYRTVASRLMVPEYERYGHVDVLPIGVDTDLFAPRDVGVMREKYGLPTGRLGFWIGTPHPMKGHDLLEKYKAERPDTHWVEVWKSPRGVKRPRFAAIAQPQVAELMSACDFIAVTNRLRPWSMGEWEAMATGLQVVDLVEQDREFVPGDCPRDQVFERQWDRHTAKRLWLSYLGLG